MSFGSFGNSGNAAGNAGGVSQGSELALIQTELLGFKSIAGEAKVRLTEAWSQPPADTSSLLSIAPQKGVFAAAGPNNVVIGTTQAARQAFESKDGDSDIHPLEAQLKIPLSMRISQIAFTADENYLILSAESGGGLAVYETQALLQGNTQTSFEIGTNGEALRALVPNPTAEKAELCAIVTNNGNLFMGNLKERSIGNPLKSQVSCVSWSTKGKQLLAGLADGTIHQLTPEGETKAEIPLPPSVTNAHVSALAWLENHVILAVHAASDEVASYYHLINRQPPSSYTFHKMEDPVDAFGADKNPHYSIMRLKDFAPNLQDLLVVSSTASTDIGLLSRSKTPLSSDVPADTITNVFTTTELLDDTKRAQLPMSESFENTIPIGVSLDLSSRDKVYKPLPADEELEESPGPLPGYWVLNNEGVLCSWWIIYEESIRQGTTYSGIATGDATEPTAAPAPASAVQAPPSTSAFGSASNTSAFGSSPAPAFGGASALGAKSSPWGTAQAQTSSGGGKSSAPAFGSSSFGNAAGTSSPAFGKPSAVGFGQSGQLGMKSSPWGSGGTGGSPATSSAPAFGQSGFASMGGTSQQSPFGGASNAGTVSSSGGFAGFAGSSGFAAASNQQSSGGSIFASKTSSGPAFGDTNKDTAFPPPSATQSSGGASPFGSQPFKLESTFKRDPNAEADDEKPSSGGGSLFGSGFGSALGDASKKETSKDEAMGTPDAKAENFQTKSPFSLGGTSDASRNQSPFAQAGQVSSQSAKPSPFGTPALQTPPANAKSPFGSETPAKSPFASETPAKSPFASQTPAKSPFASETPAKSPFASQTPAKSPFASATPAKSPFSQDTPDHSKTPQAKNPFSLASQPSQTPAKSLFDQGKTDTSQASQAKSPFGLAVPESTTPTTTPAPNRFGFSSGTADGAPTPKGGLFGNTYSGSGSGLFKTPEAARSSQSPTPQIKVEGDEEAPLPPESTSKNTYPLGDSSSSSAATEAGYKFITRPDEANATDDDRATPKAAESEPLPSDSAPTPKASAASEGKSQTSALAQGAKGPASKGPFTFTYDAAATFASSDESQEETDEGEAAKMPPPSKKRVGKTISKSAVKAIPAARAPPPPESEDDDEGDEEASGDAESEGSGVIVNKDISPSSSGVGHTPGFTPQSSFGMGGGSSFASQAPQEKRSLFGDVSRNAPMFARPNATSPRSPSPVRSAVPNRMSQHTANRSVSAPGMASQILGASKRASQMGMTTVASRAEEDPQLKQQRLARSRREAEETKPLEDEEDDEIQKILSSNIEGSLKMDDFIAHTNVATTSVQETIPSQVEAVYRDINSMIDTLGLNARSLASFIKGHKECRKEAGRSKDDLEDSNDWVLCEVTELREVIDRELAEDLAEGRVHDVEDKLESCHDLTREMHRLRSKQEDLKKLIAIRTDPDQSETSRSLPLSTEQATQQNDLRRELAKFSKLLSEAEEGLTLLKTKLASLDPGQGNGAGAGNVPTVEAVMRTITKMTSMVEKRSGDVDVLENQMRKLRFSSVNGGNSQEGSPTTPQRNNRRSVMFSPDATAADGSPRNPRHSLISSVNSAGGRNTTPRKKVSGFSTEEKSALMSKKEKRQAVLAKLKANVQKHGVQPWPMPEDIE